MEETKNLQKNKKNLILIKKVKKIYFNGQYNFMFLNLDLSKSNGAL